MADQETTEYYRLIDGYSIVAFNIASQENSDFFGPTVVVVAQLNHHSMATALYRRANAKMVLALNSGLYRPVKLEFVMYRGPESLTINWELDGDKSIAAEMAMAERLLNDPDNTTPGPHEDLGIPSEIDGLATEIVCRMAMASIPGYVDFAKSINLAYAT